MKVKDVLEVIRAYHEGEIQESQAIEKLRSVTPLELYLAEVEMYQEGYQESEIKDISKLFLDLLREESIKSITPLGLDHPLKILVKEHNMINSFLLTVDDIVMKLSDDPSSIEKEKFEKILNNLDELKKHIRREEELIFPLLNEKGYANRTILLASDHSEFMDAVEKLSSLCDDIEENKEQIIEQLNVLIYRLRDHAFIENDMFYPLALEKIPDWEKIKQNSEAIGYCEFEPID
ncbi:MAG: hemerythrin domain-containing protein [Thermoplasmata archaeon]